MGDAKWGVWCEGPGMASGWLHYRRTGEPILWGSREEAQSYVDGCAIKIPAERVVRSVREYGYESGRNEIHGIESLAVDQSGSGNDLLHIMSGEQMTATQRCLANSRESIQVELDRVLREMREAHQKAKPPTIWGDALRLHYQECIHAGMRRTMDGIHCDACGVTISDQAIKAIGTPRYDADRMKLADTCGDLKAQVDDLLRENATLRRKLERAEKRRG